MNDIVVFDGLEINAYAAITESEQSFGLMHREWPPPPMFFPYKSAGIRKFWMKNTISPLDIIFCNAGKVVSIMSGEPMSTALIGPNVPVDLVVELPRGAANSHGIKIGSSVSIRYSTKSAAKFVTKSLL